MKPSRLLFAVLLQLAAVVQLQAQPIGADGIPLAEIRTKAEKGDAEAQHRLGECYSYGVGVTEDGAEALKWYRKAAENGNAEGKTSIGYCYERGEGVAQDHAEAVKWYREAAKQGSARGQYLLGKCYSSGNGVSKDDSEKVKWYRKAAEQGLYGAQVSLYDCYHRGKGVQKDEAEAQKWLNLAAAQEAKGEKELFGASAVRTQEQIAKHIAEQFEPNKPASFESSMSVQKAPATTKEDSAFAQFNTGFRYEMGIGKTKNLAEAVEWYRKAAEQGYLAAQSGLGRLYLKGGDGVGKNELEAINWFQKAAEKGDIFAQSTLGAIYSTGDGVAEDKVEAVKWYLKAANQGDKFSQGSLGFSYLTGRGVPKDHIAAHKWFNLAASQGDEEARKELAQLETRMSSEQVTEAQRLAREFRVRSESETNSPDSAKNSNDTQPSASGSAFFITPGGHLISNAHVVNGANRIRLVTSSGTISATVIRVDSANDLALLKAEGKFSPLPVTSSRSVKLGATVATVGFPNIGLQGFAPKLAKGEIASLTGAADDPRYFQISVPVQPGNSGGALVDERGNVVGVVSAKLNAAAALQSSGALPENVNYAIKSSFLLSFLESVPEVAARLAPPNTKEEKFEDVVKSAERAAVLVLVY
jgi:TPR repeat protein